MLKRWLTHTALALPLFARSPLRADPATTSMLVAAFTASAMKSDRERIVSAGFDAYLSKPIEVREFLAAVRALCDRRGGGPR